jgi:hypothetical protein
MRFSSRMAYLPMGYARIEPVRYPSLKAGLIVKGTTALGTRDGQHAEPAVPTCCDTPFDLMHAFINLMDFSVALRSWAVRDALPWRSQPRLRPRSVRRSEGALLGAGATFASACARRAGQ